jgi:hypothetical protein
LQNNQLMYPSTCLNYEYICSVLSTTLGRIIFNICSRSVSPWSTSRKTTQKIIMVLPLSNFSKVFNTHNLSMADDAATAADAAKQDEVRRKLLKPKVSEDEALSILLDLFLADGFNNTTDAELPRVQVIQELDSYDDVNYLVKIDGEEALLKIHNGVESEQYIAAHAQTSQVDKPPPSKRSKVAPDNDDSSSLPNCSIIDLHSAIYKHFSDSKYNVATGKTISSKKSTSSSDVSSDNGVCIRELNVVSSQHSPQQLSIRLQSWVHGTPLSSIPYCPIETLLDAGSTLGRMCHALDDLASTNEIALTSAKRYHAWDGKNLLDVRPYITHIDNAEKRNLVTCVVDEFQKVIIDGKVGEKKFRLGIIHGDFNDANIVSTVYLCHVHVKLYFS